DAQQLADYTVQAPPRSLYSTESFPVLLLDKLNYNVLASQKISSNHFSLQCIAPFEAAKQTYSMPQDTKLSLCGLNHLKLASSLQSVFRNPSDECIKYPHNPFLIAPNSRPLHEIYAFLKAPLRLVLRTFVH